MKTNKESFVIFKSFYEPIKDLSDEQLGKLFRAIFQYQIDGTINTDDSTKMALLFFVNQFKLDDIKYQKICDRNKNNADTRWNTKNTTGTSGINNIPNKPMDTKNADNDIDNEKDNDNDIYKRKNEISFCDINEIPIEVNEDDIPM